MGRACGRAKTATITLIISHRQINKITCCGDSSMWMQKSSLLRNKYFSTCFSEYVSALIFFDAIQRVQRGNSPQLFENFAWNAKRRLRPRGIPRREKRTKQESLPGHDYNRLKEVAAATPSGAGGRASQNQRITLMISLRQKTKR